MTNIVLSNTSYKVVGTRPIRHDGADKVTGRAKYGGDFEMAGMLHGKVLRSPHAHARIKSIDTTAAEALPGVRAVVTGADLPIAAKDNPPLSARAASDNILAGPKALFRGHPIAAVAADSPHLAEEAVALIKVDYETLRPNRNVLDAMKDDADLLHDELTTTEFGEPTDKRSNVSARTRYEQGDVDRGFAEADYIIEREFNTRTVHQGYIEPQNASALWNADGHLTVWTSTQGAFTARDALAGVLDIPVSQIKVVPMEIGGGFGGKIPLYLEPVAALLSKKTGRPVKMQMTRTETFEATGPTSGAWFKVKMGAKKDGALVAADAVLCYEAGAYPGSSPVTAGMQCLFAPYEIPHQRVEGYDVVTNKPRSFAYRAPGAPISAFGGEQIVDELAAKCGMDPLEFRLKNASKEGTRRVDGPEFPVIGNIECLEAARDTDHYRTELAGPNRGRGVASGFWFNVGMASSASISVNADGTIALVEGSTDIGGTRASLAMQAAEALGIPAEDVRPSVADTDSVGYTFLTGGSRTTFASGWAAYECAQEIRRQMIERAGRIWDKDPGEIDLADGIFKHQSDEDLQMSFKELAAQLARTGGPISAQVSSNPSGVGGAFGTHLVDVAVDPDTGKVDILRYTAVQDAGKAVHPSYVEGQMQGGAVQGIGWALNEEYFMNDAGDMVNSSFLDYRMPTSLDLPMIDTVIVEKANPGHPYGVRGVGEVPIVPPMAAIANAIHNAVGVRMENLPMSPGAILEELWAQDGR